MALLSIIQSCIIWPEIELKNISGNFFNALMARTWDFLSPRSKRQWSDKEQNAIKGVQ